MAFEERKELVLTKAMKPRSFPWLLCGAWTLKGAFCASAYSNTTSIISTSVATFSFTAAIGDYVNAGLNPGSSSSTSTIASDATLSKGLLASSHVPQPAPVAGGTSGTFGNSTVVNLPSTGTGSAYASSCNAALLSWRSEELSYALNHTTYFMHTTTEYSTYQMANYSVTGPMTTLCDGVPRMLVSIPSYQSVKSDTMTWTSTVFGNYTEPAPTCSIGTSDCVALSSAYESSWSSWLTGAPLGAPEPSTPACWTYTTATGPCDQCVINAGNVQVFYWPVRTVDGDLCLGNGSTVEATPTGVGPNTAVISGKTYTSPTVYLTFDYVNAGPKCGTPKTGGVLPLAPESLSSVTWISMAEYENGQMNNVAGPYSFNYANLNNPVPWSAYSGMSKCQDGYCSTIYQDYNPWIAVPSELRNMDPAWKECLTYLSGIYDPPRALQPASSVVGPSAGPDPVTSTTAMSIYSTPAAPASMPSSAPASTKPAQASHSRNSQPSPYPYQSSAQSEIAAPYSSDEPASETAASKQTYPSAPDPAGVVASLLGGGSSTAHTEPSVPQPASSKAPSDPSPANSEVPSASSLAGGTFAPTLVQTSGPIDPVPSVQDPAGRPTSSPGTTIPQVPIDPAAPVTSHASSLSILAIKSESAAITLGSLVATANSKGEYAIGSQTLVPGSNAITVAGQAYSLDPSGTALVVADDPRLYRSGPASQPVHVGSVAITAGGYSRVMLGTTTLSAGLQTNIDGTLVSIGSSQVIVGSGSVAKTKAIPAPSPSSDASNLIEEVESLPNTSDPGSSDPNPNAATVTAGSGVVTATNGQLVAAPNPSGMVTFTAGSQILLESDGTVAMQSTTLSVGGAGTSADGHSISALSNGVVLDGTTLTGSLDVQHALSVATLTIGASTMTAVEEISNNRIIASIDGTTLALGGSAIDIDGENLSLGSAGIVEGGSTTIAFSRAPPAATGGPSSADVTISPSVSTEASARTSSGSQPAETNSTGEASQAKACLAYALLTVSNIVLVAL